MNFYEVLNLIKKKHNLPSYIAKNRIYLPYILKVKKVFNFFGFTYRSNAWYINKINNLLNYVKISNIFYTTLFVIILLFCYKNLYLNNLIMFTIWKIWNLFELFLINISFILFYIWLRIKVWISTNFFKITQHKVNTVTQKNLYNLDLQVLETKNSKNFIKSEWIDFFINKDNYARFVKIYYHYYKFIQSKPSTLTPVTSFHNNYSLINFIKKKNKNTLMTNIPWYIHSKNIKRHVYNNENKDNESQYLLKYMFSSNRIFLNNFSSLKYNQWIFKYCGLNAPNNSILLDLNKKFLNLNNLSVSKYSTLREFISSKGFIFKTNTDYRFITFYYRYINNTYSNCLKINFNKNYYTTVYSNLWLTSKFKFSFNLTRNTNIFFLRNNTRLSRFLDFNLNQVIKYSTLNKSQFLYTLLVNNEINNNKLFCINFYDIMAINQELRSNNTKFSKTKYLTLYLFL